MVDIADPTYFDDAAIDRELRRVFDVCHTCRRCDGLYYPPHRWTSTSRASSLRDRASRVQQAVGPRLRERILVAADAVGRLATSAAPLVNSVNESPLARAALEKTAGIRRDWLLPTDASESFLDGWRPRGAPVRPRGARSGPSRRSGGCARGLAVEERVLEFIVSCRDYRRKGKTGGGTKAWLH